MFRKVVFQLNGDQVAFLSFFAREFYRYLPPPRSLKKKNTPKNVCSSCWSLPSKVEPFLFRARSLSFYSPKKNNKRHHHLPSLKLTGKAPENGWLEDDPFLLGRLIFRCELLVAGRVIKKMKPPGSYQKAKGPPP